MKFEFLSRFRWSRAGEVWGAWEEWCWSGPDLPFHWSGRVPRACGRKSRSLGWCHQVPLEQTILRMDGRIGWGFVPPHTSPRKTDNRFIWDGRTLSWVHWFAVIKVSINTDLIDPDRLYIHPQGFNNVFFFSFLDERNNRLLFSSKNKKKKTLMNSCHPPFKSSCFGKRE